MVIWRKLLYGNIARFRAMCTLWLSCQDRLATKERLNKFGLFNDYCCFCMEKETIQNLLFSCSKMKDIWNDVLAWMQINHKLIDWKEELIWNVEHSKGKWWRAVTLKCAIAEIVYAVWNFRDAIYFRNTTCSSTICPYIIDIIF